MNEIDSFIENILSGKKSKKSVMDQLYRQPQKEKLGDAPTMPYLSPNYWCQCDTLYLPNDKGYIYALVVVDVGSRLVDAEAMKSRDESDLIKAFKAIFKRKIISIPKVMTSDAGTEFRGKVEMYLTSIGIHHNIAKAGRSRAVSCAERKNQTIGKIIHKIILKVELATEGKHSTSKWVEYLPNIISMINKKVHESFEDKEKKVDTKKDVDFTPSFNPAHKTELLKVGDKVRVALDKPKDIHGNPKFGGFRSSDIR